MRKVLAWVLLLTLCLGLFAGCNNTQEPEATEGTTEPTVEVDPNGAANALAYVKTMYKNAGEKTPKDFTRVGVVPIGQTKYEVVWTADVAEDLVKIVVLDNGMVTIDVNEATEVDVPYVLTATVTGADGQEHTFSWNHLIPAAMSVEDILNDAYALADGEALPYEVTLTGKIKSIDTAYSADYQNITVTIEVEGYEDQPVQCYRLKGEGAEGLSVGNIITVTGTIKNYKGTIEFDAGCVLDNVEEGDAVEAPTDPFEIIDAAYELARGDSLPYPVTLSGIITSIDTPYDDNYKNITVTIAVPGRLNKPIMCYRMKGENLTELKTSDVITVSGTIVNYEGTREFNSGCQLISVEPGSGHTQPKDPVKVVEEAYNLPLAGNLLYDAELTGKITKINTKYSASYGNITVTFVVEGAEDKPIECYRMTGDNSKLAALKVGDTITVKGLIKNYYSFSSNTSKIQYDKPVMLDCVLNSTPTEPTLSAMKPVADVKTGTAYKFGFQQNNLTGKPWQMITGDMDGYYGATVTDASQAIDTYIEETTGGYYIYTQKGSTKQYINIVVSGTYYNVKYQATPSSVWTLNTQYRYVKTTCTDGTEVYLGTYGQNSTLGASKTSYISNTSTIGVSQFCAYFLEVDPNGGSTEPDVPGGTTTETTIVTNPTAGTAYKLIMDQKTNGTTLFFDGNTESASVNYRLAGVEDATAAIDVYLESTTGGYYLYYMNGSQKTYIRIYERTDGDAGYGKGSLELVTSAPAEVLTWDSTYNTLVYKADADNSYFLGTYSTYVTFSVSNMSYLKASTVDVTQFPARFATISGGSTGGTTTETTVVTNPTAGTAYKMLMDQKTNGTVLYFDGNTESATVNYRLAGVEDLNAAIDVYLESTTGGYYLYFMNGGTKTYIRIYERTDGDAGYGKGSLEYVTTAPAEVLTWDSTYNTLVYKADADNSYYLGTYSTYVTFSVSNTSYLKASTVDVSQFPARFATVGGSGNQGGGNQGGNTGGTTTGATVVTNPAAATAYKLGMDKGDGTVLYFNGQTESASVTYRLATTTDINEAVDVYLEQASGGYLLYFMNEGTKTYIRVFHRTDGDPGYGKGSLEYVTTAPSEVFTYNTDANTLFYDYDGNNAYYMGTYSTYTTFSVSNTSYITGNKASAVDTTQFPARFYTTTGGSTGGGNQGGNEGGGTTTPSGDYVTNPTAGTAYKMGMDKGDGTVLYFNGLTESASVTYRLATTTNASEAVDVYLESVSGGYRLYFMNGGTKTYIRVFHFTDGDPGYGKGSLEYVTTAPSEVFTYNTDANTLFYDYDGNNAYYMGTYSTYTTFSVSNTSYITGSKASSVDVTQFPARFYASTGGSVTPPVTPEPEPPAATGTKYTISDYAKGATGAAVEEHKLDSNVTVTVYNKSVFDKQIRLYDSTSTDYPNAYATIAFSKAVTKLVLNAGYKSGELTVWASNDGVTWTEITVIDFNSTYTDYTVDLGAGYTYVKLQAAGGQARIPYFLVTFKEN